MYIYAFIFNIPRYNFIVKYDNISYYLGDIYSCDAYMEREETNLKMIVNCTEDLETSKNLYKDIILYRIPISDISIRKSTEYILDNIIIIEKSIFSKLQNSENNISVLFHCRNGCQRSALCLALYISLHYNINIDEIISIIKENRKMAFKPFLFKKCVNDYKKKYFIKNNDY